MTQILEPAVIAQIVRDYLQRERLSQEQFAKQAGVSQATVSRLLGAERDSLTRENLAKLRAAVPVVVPTVDLGPAGATKVFLSSTFHDLQERRKHVRVAIEDFPNLKCIAMERFTASTQPTVESCLEAVRQSHLYIGILAYRYGWMPPGQPAAKERSITELEYDAAVEAGIDRLMFLVDESKVPLNLQTDVDGENWEEPQKRLRAFKGRILNSDARPALFTTDVDLVQKVNVALREWYERQHNQRVQVAVPQRPADYDALDRFRAASLAAHRYLPIVGFPTSFRVDMQLEELFVPLRARSLDGDSHPSGSSFDGLHGLGLQELEQNLPFALPPESPLGSDTRPARTVFGAADEAGRRLVLVTGPAGSGKTCLGRRLVHGVLTQDAERLLGLRPLESPSREPQRDSLLPLFLSLKQLTKEHIDGSLAQLLTAFLPKSAHLDQDFVERLLERGSLLFLLDGLDEVAADLRVDVARWCARLIEEVPNSWAVVTSRPAGYDGPVREAMDEAVFRVDIQPFDSEQAEMFIRRWYGAVERGSAAAGWEERAQNSADDIIKRLRAQERSASRILELTANPLLLTVICLVHRDKGSYLPDDQVRLYGEASDVLLEHWRRANTNLVSLTAVQSRTILGPLAYHLHAKERRSATMAELGPIVRGPLQRVDKERAPEDLLAFLRDESGIFCGHGPEEWGFLHLAFQEYFSAFEIREQIRRFGFREAANANGLLRKLASHFGESWWEQVFRLLFALPEEPHLYDDVLERVLRDRPQILAEHEVFHTACLREAKEPTLRAIAAFLDRSLVGPVRPKLQDAVDAAVRACLYREDPGHGILLEPERAKRVVQHAPLASAEVVMQLAARKNQPGHGALADVYKHRATWAVIEAAAMKRFTHQKSGIEFVRIPEGELASSKPRVASFWFAPTPVTNEQYRRFVEATGHESPPAWREAQWSDPRQPVVTVSWDDAQAYCKWAGLRLPSEAEWEYACRAGTTTAYWSGDSESNLDRVGWYSKNSDGTTRPVAQKPANPWGLHDMHGNVWEWCEDESKADAGNRGFRGGSWAVPAGRCHSTSRTWGHPSFRLDRLGFRPAWSHAL